MNSITFRWFGAAGMALTAAGHTLAIDPFFTRPALWRLWLGRVISDERLSLDKLPQADAILVSHSHYDHIMDVPAIARRSRAQVFASHNGCELLAACGVPTDQIHRITPGEAFDVGPFQVQALSARHMWIPTFNPGRLPMGLHLPLRIHDYVMDDYYNFLIQLGGLRLLVWNDARSSPAVPADVLFVMPIESSRYYQVLLPAVRPRLIIPIHWDDFFRPLSKPLRPNLLMPAWRWPPTGRIDLNAFNTLIARLAPYARLLLPELFQTYTLE
jgi:L-ascorbate metabolism protein UlaG (beta-lactamase superfamily)